MAIVAALGNDCVHQTNQYLLSQSSAASQGGTGHAP